MISAKKDTTPSHIKFVKNNTRDFLSWEFVLVTTKLFNKHSMRLVACQHHDHVDNGEVLRIKAYVPTN